MKKLLWGGFMFAALLACVSCSEEKELCDTSYLPFTTSYNGKWGLIGTDGKVLFEDEFKEEPTSARNGRFLVKNEKGLWEIYTAEAKPEKIGDEYLQIADFTASVTPSVKKNEKICLIDVDGNVKVTLDKVNNKNIIACTAFSYGFAVIMTEDFKSGLINTKGEIVIEPNYAFIFPFSSSIFYAVEDTSDEFQKIKILDANGKDILELKVGNGQKFTGINLSACTSKYVAVCTTVDGEPEWGYIDYSKEIVVKPSSKIRSIGEVKGDKFIFKSGEYFGVMNFEGEVVLRAKYDQLSWADDDLLIAYNSDSKYSIINLEGEKLTKEKYLAILPYFDGKHAAVKINDNSWGFIDKKGEELKNKNAPDIYFIEQYSANLLVESDFVDIDAIVSELKLDKDGMLGININMNPQQVVKAYNEVEGNKYGSIGVKAEENIGIDNLLIEYSSSGLNIESKVYYLRPMTIFDDNKIVWAQDQPFSIEANVSGEKLTDKLDLIYEKISTIVKSYGKPMKENSGAVIVKLTEERGWVVINTKSSLYLRIFNTRDYQNFYINSYAKEGETTREYIKPSEEKSDELIQEDDSIEEEVVV